MNKICLTLILSLCAGTAWAEQQWVEVGDWQNLAGPDGCMAWTVTHDGPNAQLQIRHLLDGTWHIELRGAEWTNEIGMITEANPFRDRTSASAEITIEEVGSGKVMPSNVQFLGDRNIIPHTDTASTTAILDQLSAGSANGSNLEIRVKGERVGVFSTKGYPEALGAYSTCEAGLVVGN